MLGGLELPFLFGFGTGFVIGGLVAIVLVYLNLYVYVKDK